MTGPGDPPEAVLLPEAAAFDPPKKKERKSTRHKDSGSIVNLADSGGCFPNWRLASPIEFHLRHGQVQRAN